MIVAVISPARGLGGVSTVSLLLGTMLSGTQKKRVCLTHLAARSNVFCDYYGLQAQEDSLSSPTQVVKLLREGSVTQSELADYTLRVNNNYDIFCNDTAAISDEDMAVAQKYLLAGMPHEFIITDIDTPADSPIAKYVIEKAAAVIMCVTQNTRVLNDTKSMFEYIPKEKTIILCNHYSQRIMTIQEIAKSLGVSAKSQICVLRHTDYIPKLANAGRLDILPDVAKTEPLPSVEEDLKILTRTIMMRYNLRETKKQRKKG